VSAPATLAPAFDLLAAYEPGGVLVERAGLGVATGGAGRWVPVDEVGPALRAAPTGAVAAGVLPFAGEGALRLADRIVRRTSPGETQLVGEAASFARAHGRAAPADAFTAVQRHPHPSPEGYADAVATATARMGADGDLRKVVLARTLEVDAGRALDPSALAHRLRAVDPDAWTFAAPSGDGTLVGATPELLVSRRGLKVRSNPLAGTAPRAGDPAEDHANADRLLASPKDREEHAIVVEAVAAVLGPRCDDLRWDPEPVLQATPTVWHLSTRFEGTLSSPAPSALELALALHPTPAIGGWPVATSLDAIASLEPFERGGYAGPVGWVDAEGDGEFAIALRCALLRGERATLYAGAGIVAASDPAAEVDETERKFGSFLDALRWG